MGLPYFEFNRVKRMDEESRLAVMVLIVMLEKVKNVKFKDYYVMGKKCSGPNVR